MALRVELKPGERFVIGDSLIANGETRATLFIEGDAPILRERDLMRPTEVDTLGKQIYFLIQLMYLHRDVEKYRMQYFEYVDALVRAAPRLLPILDAVNHRILTGHLYKALKEAKALLAQEEELMRHVEKR